MVCVSTGMNLECVVFITCICRYLHVLVCIEYTNDIMILTCHGMHVVVCVDTAASIDLYIDWFWFSAHRMVRGKDHGQSINVEECSFSPRLTHLVTFAPRMTRIHPAVHVQVDWNDASITCWYQRQVPLQSRPLNKARQVQHLYSRLGGTGPQQLNFSRAHCMAFAKCENDEN